MKSTYQMNLKAIKQPPSKKKEKQNMKYCKTALVQPAINKPFLTYSLKQQK